jgi:hypothetical protein
LFRELILILNRPEGLILETCNNKLSQIVDIEAVINGESRSVNLNRVKKERKILGISVHQLQGYSGRNLQSVLVSGLTLLWPEDAMKTYGGVEVWFHAFLTSELD